jgi:hypothetical protein
MAQHCCVCDGVACNHIGIILCDAHRNGSKRPKKEKGLKDRVRTG